MLSNSMEIYKQRGNDNASRRVTAIAQKIWTFPLRWVEDSGAKEYDEKFTSNKRD